MGGVVAPVVEDVKNLGAEDAAEHDQDAEVPGFIAVIAEALGVADADPEADEDAGGDEEPVGGKKEAADMKELRIHSLLDAGVRGLGTGSV